MSNHSSKAAPAAAAPAEPGREARRLAAAILEVLAGARTPGEAAAALGLSLPRYYQVEHKAVRGLVAALEPQPRGRRPDPDREVVTLQRDNARLRRELGRQQALVRAGQRVVGLPPPAPPRPGGKKPRRRKVAKALRLAAQLQRGHNDASAAAVAATDTAAPAV